MNRVHSRDIRASREKKQFEIRNEPRFGVMNACSVGQRAYEWDDRHHGIFTAHLLDALEKGIHTYTGISSYLSDQITRTTMRMNKEQTPTFRFEGSGDILLGHGKSSPLLGGPKLVITPEDVTQIEIKDYQIEDIQLSIENISTPESQEPTLEQMGQIRLPKVPQTLRRMESKLLEIQRAISGLESGEHPALVPAQGVVRQAQAQFNRIKRDRDQNWSGLSSSDSESLAESIRKNPKAAPTTFMSLRPKELSVSAFIMTVLWEQKRLAAEEVLSKAKREITQKQTNVITGLQEQTTRTKTEYQEESKRFCSEVVDIVLSSCTDYDVYSASIPYEELVPKLPVLEQYGLGWQEDNLWLLAERRWKNDRPAVREKQKRLAREKAERERLVKEKAERLAREWSGKGVKAGESKTGTLKGVKYTFHWCPAGTFMMGSPESEKDREDIERQHKVILTRGFWMLETPVMQAMWESVMGNNPSNFKGSNLPVERVSWNDSQEFIEKLNSQSNGLQFRLPSEAEWEYACRARTTTPFSFGNTLNGDKANCYGKNPYGTTEKGKYLRQTSEVKSYSPNVWGLYDMHGNVWEWCQDWYGDYPCDAVTDPTGPRGAAYRVNRGGSWNLIARYCRSACRSGRTQVIRYDYLGFRLALSLTR